MTHECIGLCDVCCSLDIFEKELEAFTKFWLDLSNSDVDKELRRYAAGNAHALDIVWKTLFGKEGFSLGQWVEMEGPEGVEWNDEQEGLLKFFKRDG